MLSGSVVHNDYQALKGYKENYASIFEGLSGSWKGTSYDSISAKAAKSLNSGLSSIREAMTHLKTAIELYEDYQKLKKQIETDKARLDKQPSKGSENYTSTVASVVKSLTNAINKNEEELKRLEKQIKSELSAASSVSVEKKSSKNNSTNVDVNYSKSFDMANQLGGTSGILPNARIGEKGRPDPSNNKFFQNEANGGINGYPLNGGGPGVGGNCTYYAYSRFSELLGKEAHGIAGGDACSWYSNTKGYKKGKKPKLGSIAVWQYGNSNSNGHVAVVEQIKDNGDIVVSEGGWSNRSWYNNRTYSKDQNYNTGYNNGHLLGFIYPEEE